MPSLVIVTAKQKLVDLLKARTGLAGVQVTYGWPGDDKAQAERIFTGSSRGDMQVAAMRSGRTFYNEQPVFDVTVQVEVAGGSSEIAESRAMTLGIEVHQTIADNRTPTAVPGLNWWEGVGWELNAAYNDAGHIAELVYHVRYDARLT